MIGKSALKSRREREPVSLPQVYSVFYAVWSVSSRLMWMWGSVITASVFHLLDKGGALQASSQLWLCSRVPEESKTKNIEMKVPDKRTGK